MTRVTDLEVVTELVKIRGLSRKLCEITASGNEMQLFILLSDIERAANRAQNRMNDLLYGKGFKPPVEMMGQ